MDVRQTKEEKEEELGWGGEGSQKRRDIPPEKKRSCYVRGETLRAVECQGKKGWFPILKHEEARLAEGDSITASRNLVFSEGGKYAHPPENPGGRERKKRRKEIVPATQRGEKGLPGSKEIGTGSVREA